MEARKEEEKKGKEERTTKVESYSVKDTMIPK